MERPFDDQFKDQLSNYEEQPTDLSWIAVSSHLDAQRARRKRNNFIALATVMLLGAGGYLGWNATQDMAYGDQLRAAHHAQFPVPSIERDMHRSSATQLPLASAGSAVTDGQEASASLEAVAHGVHEMEQSSMHHVPFNSKLSTLGASSAFTGNMELPEGGPFILEDGTIRESAFKGFKVGLMGGVQHTSLHGHAIDNYMADRQISKVGGMRPLFGIAARYDFSRTFGLETNLIISSEEGQLFDLEGATRNLSLNFIRIPVMASYQFAKIGQSGKYPNAVKVMAGLQYGRLNWVNLDDFGSDLQPDNFNTNELGLAAGVAYDQYFSEDYLLTAGLRGSVNNHYAVFPNVFNAQKMVSYNLGAYVQLNFNIR